MLDHADITHVLYHLVIHCSKEIDKTIFLTWWLYAADNLVALLPLFHKYGDKLHRILEICTDRNNAVTIKAAHSVKGWIELTKICDIKDGLYLGIASTDALDLISCAICWCVINKDNLVVVTRQLFLKYCFYCCRDSLYIFHLVKAWNQDTDFLHKTPYKRPNSWPILL